MGNQLFFGIQQGKSVKIFFLTAFTGTNIACRSIPLMSLHTFGWAMSLSFSFKIASKNGMHVFIKLTRDSVLSSGHLLIEAQKPLKSKII
jgi:hypothetical protein